MTAWWQESVIYQIYPRSFQDTTGDGVGDLRGIIGRLDYLSETLGVDAVWLSPFYPSPMKDFGYDVADYCDVDPMFGTLDDFDNLLEALHLRDMRLIVDFVPNHTSDTHPWFEAARSSRDDPKRRWYVWRDGAPGGGPPNNWLSQFGGPAWEHDPATGQWYLHSFLPEQPDLDWRNPELEAAMLDVLRFWLDRGVDGFRIDVAHFIMKDPAYRDLPPDGEQDPGDPVHRLGHPDALEAFRRIRAVLDEYEDRFAVGEIHEFDVARWVGWYGDHDGLHMPFNFMLLRAPWDAGEMRRLVDGIEATLPQGAWPNYVLGNHDETRLATRYGPEHARAAAVLLLTLRGTPTLFQGDELGIEEVVIPDDRVQDPFGLRVPGKGRDGCRTPMAWDASPVAGFSAPGVDPWLPLHPDWRERNVSDQLADPTSILNLYRLLLEVRASSSALRVGSYRAIDGVPPECFAYLREHGEEAAATVINFGASPIEAAVAVAGTIVVSTGMDRAGDEVAGPIRLGPGEAVVVSVADRSPAR